MIIRKMGKKYTYKAKKNRGYRQIIRRRLARTDNVYDTPLI